MKKGNRGFSLIEILISASIMLVVVSAEMGAISYCNVLNRSSDNLVSAINDAQMVLEQLKARAYSTIPSYTAPALANLKNETVYFSPSITSFNTAANYNNLAVRIVWSEPSGVKYVTLQTSISK